MSTTSRLISLRTELLGRLTTRIHTGTHTNIVGGPGSGKSDLIRSLLRGVAVPTACTYTVFIDPDEFNDGGAPEFWRSLAAVLPPSDEYTDLSVRTLLRRLRASGVRLLVAIDGLDELVARPWVDVAFLSSLRAFAQGGGSADATASPRPVSVLTTSRYTISELQATVKRRFGSLTFSPPFNHMADFPLAVATREEILAYAQLEMPHRTPKDHEFLYQLALGHPRLTCTFVQALAESREVSVRPAESLVFAATETLASQDHMLRQMFDAFPRQYAFVLICEVLDVIGTMVAELDMPLGALSVGRRRSAGPPRDPILACEELLCTLYKNASEARTSLDRFSTAVARRAPNEIGASLQGYVRDLIALLERDRVLLEYLDFLETTDAAEHRTQLGSVRMSLDGRRRQTAVPSLRRDRTHFVLGECATYLGRHGVILANSDGSLSEQVAHLWKWWLLKELGANLGRSLEDWLCDMGLDAFARGENLALLRRLSDAAQPALVVGSQVAIRREVAAHCA